MPADKPIGNLDYLRNSVVYPHAANLLLALEMDNSVGPVPNTPSPLGFTGSSAFAHTVTTGEGHIDSFPSPHLTALTETGGLGVDTATGRALINTSEADIVNFYAGAWTTELWFQYLTAEQPNFDRAWEITGVNGAFTGFRYRFAPTLSPGLSSWQFQPATLYPGVTNMGPMASTDPLVDGDIVTLVASDDGVSNVRIRTAINGVDQGFVDTAYASKNGTAGTALTFNPGQGNTPANQYPVFAFRIYDSFLTDAQWAQNLAEPYAVSGALLTRQQRSLTLADVPAGNNIIRLFEVPSSTSNPLTEAITTYTADTVLGAPQDVVVTYDVLEPIVAILAVMNVERRPVYLPLDLTLDGFEVPLGALMDIDRTWDPG